MEREKLDRRGLSGDSPKHWFDKDNLGRPPGSKNKTTKAMRELVAEAMDKLGADGRGKQGALGFVTAIGKRNPTHLLAAAVKMEAAKTVAAPLAQPDLEERYTPEEVAAQLYRRGISADLMHHLAEKYLRPLEAARQGTPLNGSGVPRIELQANDAKPNGRA
jgi:hypothetical protein